MKIKEIKISLTEAITCDALELNYIADKYGLDGWSYDGVNTVTFHSESWTNMGLLIGDIEAGTVWTPPKLNYLSYDTETIEAMMRDHIDQHRRLSAAEAWRMWDPYDALALSGNAFGTAGNLYGLDGAYPDWKSSAVEPEALTIEAISKAWHMDAELYWYSAHSYATDNLGLPAALPPGGLGYAPEPVVAKTWKHGYCAGCKCELSPAMDGEGATKCSGCSR